MPANAGGEGGFYQPDVAGLHQWANERQDSPLGAGSQTKAANAKEQSPTAGGARAGNTAQDPGAAGDPIEANAGYDKNCASSVAIKGQGYGCDNTIGFNETAQMTNMVGQLGGSLAVTTSGQLSQLKAAEKGTQSSALEASAGNTKLAGMKELSMGAANAAFAFKQFQNAKGHEGNEKELHKQTTQALKDEKTQIALVQAEALRTTGKKLDEREARRKAQENIARQGNDVARAAFANEKTTKGIGFEAAAEQGKVAKETKDAAFVSMIQGAQQLVNGVTAIGAAAQLQSAADKARNTEGIAFNFNPPAPTQIGPGDALSPRAPTAIRGDGTSGDKSEAEGDEQAQQAADLGDPFNTNPNPDGLVNPAPKEQKFAAKGSDEAKGSPASMSVGSTSPATGGGDVQTNPAPAANGSGLAYQGGGGGGGGYQGGGGGRAGGDSGPDLSNMLAQFLPKKEDDVSQNTILDFGGRSPAGEEQMSLIDRNANIFDRIHQAYQDKQKKKNVGI